MAGRTALATVVVVMAMVAQLRSAAAESKSWTAVSGSWTDGDNWSPPGQPQASDDVTIDSGSVVLAVDATIASLTLSGGVLGGSGTLTVVGPVVWTAGTMGGSGTTVAMDGMELGGANKTLEGRAIVLSGGTGVITAVDGADGGIDETETLVVALGDGTGLVQTRERRCESDFPECNDPPWEALSRHRLCDLEVPSPAKEACEQNLVNRCEWSPLDLKNCRDVEESTCEYVARRL